jgi:hypothetical protein
MYLVFLISSLCTSHFKVTKKSRLMAKLEFWKLIPKILKMKSFKNFTDSTQTQWLKHGILATWEVKINGIMVWRQPRENVYETPSQAMFGFSGLWPVMPVVVKHNLEYWPWHKSNPISKYPHWGHSSSGRVPTEKVKALLFFNLNTTKLIIMNK